MQQTYLDAVEPESTANPLICHNLPRALASRTIYYSSYRGASQRVGSAKARDDMRM